MALSQLTGLKSPAANSNRLESVGAIDFRPATYNQTCSMGVMGAASRVMSFWYEMASENKQNHQAINDGILLAQRELETKSLAKANARALSSLADSEEGNLSAWNSWVAKDLGQQDWIVYEQPVSSYALPAGFANFLGKDMILDWNSIAGEVAEIHSEVVGMRVSTAGVSLAGDERLAFINRRLRTWADQCVTRRIEKTQYRQGGPTRQYQDIYSELVPALEQIAFQSGTANRWFYADLCDYLPTQIYLKTVRIFVVSGFDAKRLLPTYRIIGRPPEAATPFAKLVDIYQWQHLDDLRQLVCVLCERLGSNSGQLTVASDDQIRERLQRLVDDIQEIMPFLRHNHKAENTVIEIAPDVFLSFHWAVGRGIGFMPLAPSKAELLSHLRELTSGLSLTIGYDGLLTNFSQPWITTDMVLFEQSDALRINLLIVEAVHARLFELYSKVDVAAVIARFKNRTTTEADQQTAIEPTEEEFAAVCQVLAEPGECEDVGTGRQLRAIRMQCLLGLLESKLGCEVRQGKGSEIVVYRQGGRNFILGHHKRNTYVPVELIKKLLNRVGIGFQEWFELLY